MYYAEQIQKLLQDLFNDTSQPKEDTISQLEGIQDQIELLLESLDA